LNPPIAAVRAAHSAGVAGGEEGPELGRASEAAARVRAAIEGGGLGGEGDRAVEEELVEVFKALPNAATRLAALDYLSSVSLNMLQYVDDASAFRSSRALLRKAGAEIGEEGRGMGQEFGEGPGKCEALWADPGDAQEPEAIMPVEVQDVAAPFVAATKETGSFLDREFRGERAWDAAFGKAIGKGHAVAFIRGHFGVAAGALAQFVHVHALPAVDFALELFIFEPGSGAKADRLYDYMLRRAVRLEGGQAESGWRRERRYGLLMEAGWEPVGGAAAPGGWRRRRRLRSMLEEKAVMEYIRARTEHAGHPAREVVNVAEQWVGTWSERCQLLVDEAGAEQCVKALPTAPEALGEDGRRERASRKYAIKTLRDRVIRPFFVDREERWLAAERARDPAYAAWWASSPRPAWAAYTGPPPDEYYAWSRLRIFGRWVPPPWEADMGICPVCRGEDAGWVHVVSHVPGNPGREAAWELLEVPALADESAWGAEVRRRADLVGSTILRSSRAAVDARPCARCGAGIQGGELCEGCAEAVANELWRELGWVGGGGSSGLEEVGEGGGDPAVIGQTG